MQYRGNALDAISVMIGALKSVPFEVEQHDWGPLYCIGDFGRLYWDFWNFCESFLFFGIFILETGGSTMLTLITLQPR